MFGDVYRADCNPQTVAMTRVPEGKLPNGVKAPRWNAIIAPFRGTGGFGGVGGSASLSPLEFKEIEKKPGAVVRVTLGWPGPNKKRPIYQTATVKAGQIILLRDQRYLVRAIVPPNKEHRVVGWIELSPDAIPEADLVRDNKPFVRPVTEMK